MKEFYHNMKIFSIIDELISDVGGEEDVKSWRTAVILRAVFYFMVDKGYTAPTQREIEQCISIVTQKTIEDWIK